MLEALQERVVSLERQLEQTGSNVSLQQRVNGWFKKLTPEEQAEKEANQLAEKLAYQR
jgi:hypothetical protein